VSGEKHSVWWRNEGEGALRCTVGGNKARHGEGLEARAQRQRRVTGKVLRERALTAAWPKREVGW
jgi:hypothetical protein